MRPRVRDPRARLYLERIAGAIKLEWAVNWMTRLDQHMHRMLDVAPEHLQPAGGLGAVGHSVIGG